jgi:hypothetical protein
MTKRRTDNTMTKRRTDNTMTKRRTDNTITKRRTDNTMTKRRTDNTKTDKTIAKRTRKIEQAMIYKTLNRKLKIFNILNLSIREEFEDTKGVIRIRKLKNIIVIT